MNLFEASTDKEFEFFDLRCSNFLKGVDMLHRSMPMVLIVEDNIDLQELYRMAMSQDFVLLQAMDLLEAACLYQEFRHDLFALVLDGFLEGETSLAFAKKVVDDHFQGLLIANSDHYRLQEALVEAGCHHRNMSKADLPELLVSLAQVGDNPV